MKTFHTKPKTSEERQDFYARLEAKNTAPLWESLSRLFPAEPTPASVHVLWNYTDDIRPLLLEAGRLISAKEATRRVLVLENPGIRGTSQITESLYAGIQMILPGEIAPTHRHSASAIRFIIEGSGAYTAVDGERTTMNPGDFILTPSWTYHDHGNPSDTPTIWMDGLDIPLVNLFNTGFAEHYPDEVQPVSRKEGDAWARYGGSLMPIEYTHPRKSSPIFNYPYARTRETLDQLYRNGPLHPGHGIKMQYLNPATGGYALPAIGAFVQLLPQHFRIATEWARREVPYCVVEGRGRTQIGDSMLAWREHDIFVAPSWYSVAHESEVESVLFSFSDRPVQKALGIWREDCPT